MGGANVTQQPRNKWLNRRRWTCSRPDRKNNPRRAATLLGGTLPGPTHRHLHLSSSADHTLPPHRPRGHVTRAERQPHLLWASGLACDWTTSALTYVRLPMIFLSRVNCKETFWGRWNPLIEVRFTAASQRNRVETETKRWKARLQLITIPLTLLLHLLLFHSLSFYFFFSFVRVFIFHIHLFLGGKDAVLATNVECWHYVRIRSYVSLRRWCNYSW